MSEKEDICGACGKMVSHCACQSLEVVPVAFDAGSSKDVKQLRLRIIELEKKLLTVQSSAQYSASQEVQQKLAGMKGNLTQARRRLIEQSIELDLARKRVIKLSYVLAKREERISELTLKMDHENSTPSN